MLRLTSRVTLWGGRRLPAGRPHGRAYGDVRWGVMHPTRSITIVLLGPVWFGLSVDPAR